MLSSSLARRSIQRCPPSLSQALLRHGIPTLIESSTCGQHYFSAHSRSLLDQANGLVHGTDFLSTSTRFFSQASNKSSLPRRTKNYGGHNNRKQQNTSKPPNPNSPEKFVRQNTRRILSLGEKALNSATNTTSNFQASVRDKSFWTEADQAIKWWARQGTAESVKVSFQLLDALADLSMMAQEPQFSSTLLNTKALNSLLQNWLVALARKERVKLSPTDMFAKLEDYRTHSRNTSRTRRKLRPNLETYQLLMEARSSPAGYNEFIVRHLIEHGQDHAEIRPDIKTVAHILYGWSARGQAVPVTDLKSVLTLLQDFSVSEDSDKEKNENALKKDSIQACATVELFNKALFALARGNSSDKDARRAEKMLSILNFMEFLAAEYNEKKDDIDISPNVDTYNIVLNSFARAGKGAQAEMILRNWVDKLSSQHNDNEDSTSTTAKPPVSKSFSIVITAFANSDENYAAEKSEGILRWQQQLDQDEGPLRGCVPVETITYNNVIRSWAWRRSDKGVDRCDILRKEMVQQHNLTPDIQTYRQSFKAIALSNMPEKGRRAVQVWREMEFCGITADDLVRKYFERCVTLSKQFSSPQEQHGRNRREGRRQSPREGRRQSPREGRRQTRSNRQ